MMRGHLLKRAVASILMGTLALISIIPSGIASADTTFETSISKFPESYKAALRTLHAKYPNWKFSAIETNLDWEVVIENESIVGRNLVHKNSISSWKSIADGAYDWDTSSWPGLDSASWVAASEEIIRYYMDPRNFLDETYIFQFLHHGYNASVQTASGVESMVEDTFMESSYTGTSTTTSSSGIVGPSADLTGQTTEAEETTSVESSESSAQLLSPNTLSSTPALIFSANVSLQAPGETQETEVTTETTQTEVTTETTTQSAGPGSETTSSTDTLDSTTTSGESYVDMIMAAALESGVNPYVLTAMLIQEQGTSGSSGLISGNTSPYEGIYNFFNIEAYQSGSQSAVQRGLWWASQSGTYGRPWNTKQKAITGGATYYGQNYVSAGQDTFYLKKFNVVGTNLYKHQYMSNIQGAASEGAKLSEAYSEDLKSSALEFAIPVYENMPSSAETKPTLDGSPNNKLSSLAISGYSITPTFSRDTTSYDLIVDSSVSSVTVEAQALDSSASISGTGSISLSIGSNTVDVVVTAQNQTTRTYTIQIIRQEGTTTSDTAFNPSTSSVQVESSSATEVLISPAGN